MNRIEDDYVLRARPAHGMRKFRLLGFVAIIPLAVATIALAAHRDTPAPQQMHQDQSATTVRVASAQTTTRSLPATNRQFLRAPERGLQATHVHFVPAKATGPDTPPAANAEQNTVSQTGSWVDIQIRAGDTLSLAFARKGLSYSDSLALAHLPEYGDYFTRGLREGDHLRVLSSSEGQVLAVDFPQDMTRTLRVERHGDHFKGHIVEKADVQHRSAYAMATITSTFYAAAKQAGLSDKKPKNLAHIYNWQIDFSRDIRPGDRFIVIYDELYRDGQKLRDGKILAAEFYNQGRSLEAFRYTDSDGNSDYYTPKGKTLAKAFRREPLDHYWVSSPFSRARMNPVLHVVRPHWGTDYAAPMGTPIHATGDGRIIYRGAEGGYGNLVVIDNGNGITTRYGHMSRFASGQSVGTHVERNEVIGYVGQTGLATGPHCHYEFRIDDVPQNPETVDLPNGNPLPAAQMAQFEEKIEPRLAQIKALDNFQLAANDFAPRT